MYKDFKELLSRIDKTPGWSIRHTRHGYLIKAPGGGMAHCTGTPCGIRGYRNFCAELRRIGFTVPHHGR